jgi:hypothetical protein
VVDFAPLYPAAYLPTISKELIEYQVSTYQDQFFVVDVPFFAFYRWLEVFFHLPVALWAIGALINGPSSLFSLPLLSRDREILLCSDTRERSDGNHVLTTVLRKRHYLVVFLQDVYF